MTLQEIMQAIAALSADDLDVLTEFMQHQRKSIQVQPMSDAELTQAIEMTVADAQPVELVAGTMDVAQLETAIASIRDSLTPQELDEIVRAMNKVEH